ncbi:MAG: hypothetical protein HY789_10835 [Deltaproteobacteria bacterium]|nr:hypothetical protein [Deltaproteobacteria bacterium]
MKKTPKDRQQKVSPKLTAQKSEEAMIAGILEGSPEGIGVAVIRLDCGCRKMAAVDKNGDPASKVIMYRDQAESICDKCKADNGAFARVREEFIHWAEPAPDEATRKMIEEKVLGTRPVIN